MKISPDLLLCYVVRGVLPLAILKQINDTKSFHLVVSYIKKSISISPVYVKGPEIVLRVFLVFMIAIFRLIELLSFRRLKLAGSVRRLSKIHPLLDDGIRLYLFLAMFAAFEQDSFRQKTGFPTYSDILKPFQNFKLKEKIKN